MLDREKRLERAREQIAYAYEHRPVREPAVVVGDCNYWIAGEDPALIPDAYFEEGGYESQLEFQLGKIERHMAHIPDAYVPFLFPWYGTGVVQSAFGGVIAFERGQEPAIAGPILREPADVYRLRPPDPERDGLMPRVLACIDHFCARSSLPVSFTDCQGPLAIALGLAGVESLCLWMYDDPKAVHALMDLCTMVLIDWVRTQKLRAGASMESGAFPHTILLPEGCGGVWVSDDDCTILSAPLYREFVVPYNERVFWAFGGGTLHYCGSAPQQLENFVATDGLVGINNWCMGDFGQVRRMQELFEDRLVLMVCDTTPLDPEPYFRELLGFLRPKGTILATYPEAAGALVGRRVVTVAQDQGAVAERVWATIRRLLDERG